MSKKEEISLEEAKAFIEEWPDQDDFINRHYRLTSVEGDDNSIDLAYEWRIRKEIVDANT